MNKQISDADFANIFYNKNALLEKTRSAYTVLVAVLIFKVV